MIWTLFGPVPRLATDQAFVSSLVLQGLGVCHRASPEGGQHLGMPCLFLSLLLLGLGFPFLFSIVKGIVLSGPFQLKRQQVLLL